MKRPLEQLYFLGRTLRGVCSAGIQESQVSLMGSPFTIMRGRLNHHRENLSGIRSDYLKNPSNDQPPCILGHVVYATES